MPDRIIRDELLTSERYWSVGIEAQQLFVHLLLRADSLGRFSGKNFTIRMACYPGHQRTPDIVEKLLSDLNDADLIRLYSVNGERFVFVPRYRQRLRYTNSKYPPPPKEINDIPKEKSDSSQTQVRPAPAEVKRSEEKRSKSLAAVAARTTFEVSEEMSQWAVKTGLTAEEVMPETTKFFDHHLAKGSAFKDWDAAWRNWIRNAVKFAAGRARV